MTKCDLLYDLLTIIDFVTFSLDDYKCKISSPLTCSKASLFAWASFSPEPRTELPPTWMVVTSSRLFRGWVGGSMEGKWVVPFSSFIHETKNQFQRLLFKINGKKWKVFPPPIVQKCIKNYTSANLLCFIKTTQVINTKLTLVVHQLDTLRNSVNQAHSIHTNELFLFLLHRWSEQ